MITVNDIYDFFVAISLEWDKQPHYLEASLMMKGYRPDEARAAALAGRTRRTSEVVTRPPLAATAYASTRDKVCILYAPSTHSRTFTITISHENKIYKMSFIYVGATHCTLPSYEEQIILKGSLLCFL